MDQWNDNYVKISQDRSYRFSVQLGFMHSGTFMGPQSVVELFGGMIVHISRATS